MPVAGMKALAEFILRGRWQAILAVLVTGTLTFLLPPVTSLLIYAAAAVIALVALHVGPLSGLQVMLLGSLAAGLLYSLAGLQYQVVAVMAAVVWLPAWVLAVILEQTRRLDYALRMAVIFGAVLLLAVYVLLGDPAPWWVARLHEIDRLLREAGMSWVDLTDEQLASTLAGLLTGLLITWLTLGIICSLLLARWWQSLVVHPGGFGEEFCGLRPGVSLGLLTLLAMLSSRFVSGTTGDLLAQLVMIMLVPYLFAGYAVLHMLVRQAVLAKAWLVGAYVLPALWPSSALLIAGAGLLDVWVDFRRRFGRSDSQT